MNRLPAQKVDGLIDGMRLLEELAASRETLTGVELARRTNLSPVRISRLLKTFAYLGYSRRDASGRYTPGPALNVLVAETMASSGLLRRAAGELDRFLEIVPTVALGVLWHGRVCYLYHKSRGNPVNSGLTPESLCDWERSSIGHALMAEQPPETWTRFGPEQVRELEETRRRGYALVRYPEHWTLAVTVGAPATAGLALSGMTDAAQLPELAGQLRRVSERLNPV